MENQEKIKMTREDYENLREKINNLNSSLYKTPAEEQRSLLWEINKLYSKLVNAEIIELNNTLTDVVEIGDVVTFVCSDEVEVRKLVAFNGNFREGTVSILSDLGKALYKHKIGDEVTYKTPYSEEHIKIIEIEKALNINKNNLNENPYNVPTKIKSK
ncbi:MAG TPA: hypothetical protein GXZ95_02940 [Mollicutes bacterium]|nr:hypothetical protein [Mollicutes bacterium]